VECLKNKEKCATNTTEPQIVRCAKRESAIKLAKHYDIKINNTKSMGFVRNCNSTGKIRSGIPSNAAMYSNNKIEPLRV
jgi:hypothetical protein